MTEATIMLAGALSSCRADPTTQLRLTEHDGQVVEFVASSTDRGLGVRFEVDLGDAVGYWYPGLRGARALPADWGPSELTSLVRAAPAGVLYTSAGTSLLGWAAGEAVAEVGVRAGVSEEGKAFAVEVHTAGSTSSTLTIRLDRTPFDLAEMARRLANWLSDTCGGAVRAPVSLTRRPVYSTWYTFTQEVSAASILPEADRAVELGCGSIFIDDGWQLYAHSRGYQGCGDWRPDESKFPDLAETVAAIHDRGAAVALWIAPLLLGAESDVYPELRPYAEQWAPELNCYVLDPRSREVRDFVASTCLRLVRDYAIDLLKIDFLDQAMVYRATGKETEREDLGKATETMLRQLRDTLAAAGHDDVAFEFRQPYVSPAMARYGDILRANDCPGDSQTNRTATIDSRLFSAGQVIHSDPMMWGLTGGAEAVAQQLYASWFAVPQISMPLVGLNRTQADSLAGLLDRWRDDAPITIDGDLDVQGAEHHYHLVRASRPDLDRTVIVRYAPVLVDLDERPTAETTVINATSADHVVLLTSRPIAGGTVRDATGAEIRRLARTSAALSQINVPAFGSVVIHHDDHGSVL